MRRVFLVLMICCFTAVVAGATEPVPVMDPDKALSTAATAPAGEAPFAEAFWASDAAQLGKDSNDEAGFYSCSKLISQERCQTGGVSTVSSCSQCSGPCYRRVEGWLVHYHNGKKASGFQTITYCSWPSPSIATCNSTCS